MMRQMIPVRSHGSCDAMVRRSASSALRRAIRSYPLSQASRDRLHSSLASHPSIQPYPAERMVMVNFLDTLHHVVDAPWKVSPGKPLILGNDLTHSRDITTASSYDDGNTSEDDDLEELELDELEQNAIKDTEEKFNDENLRTDLGHSPQQHSPQLKQRDVNKDHLLRDLKHAVRKRHSEWSFTAFRRCVDAGVPMDIDALHAVFSIQCQKNPLRAHEIMTYVARNHAPPTVEMYAQLCDSIGLLDHRIHGSDARLETFVKRFQFKLMTLDVEAQTRLYPRLLVSMVKQKVPLVGCNAIHLYQYMKDHDYPFDVKYMELAMANARYTRANELPFYELLHRCVQQAYQPSVQSVMGALQILFPFTDFDATLMALDAIHTLQTQSNKYKVDMGTLETISGTAATRGRYLITLKVWNILEAQRMEPTETIYENTVTAFIMGYKQDDNCFAAFADMEAKGFQPSRALIRSITRSLRFSEGRVNHAYHRMVVKEVHRDHMTVAKLNTVCSGFAETAAVDAAFSVFDDFAHYNLKPDEDTYSYMMEAISKASGSLHQPDPKRLTILYDAAETLLDTMARNNVKINHHTLHFYIHVLIHMQGREEAINAVLDAFEAGMEVSNKTLNVLINELGERGELDKVRLLASKLSERIYFVEKRIENWEIEFAQNAALANVGTEELLVQKIPLTNPSLEV